MAKITGHIVVSVDYQLAPEHKFPAAPEDCYRAAKEIFAHCDMFGNTPDDITLIGDSAGGNLAAVVSLMARDRGSFSQNARFFCILPPTTTTPKIHRLSRCAPMEKDIC